MKVDIDLQTWSELMTAISGRQTPYEDLTEIDQVSDRLALEWLEQLFDQFEPSDQQKCQAIIDRRLAEL